MGQGNRRTVSIHAGGRCTLRCPVCDCRQAATPSASALRGGGARLVLRGAPESAPSLPELLRTARREEIGQIVVRTHAHAFRAPSAASKLAAAGVDGALVPVMSQIPTVHDRIAGREGALVATLVGLRALAEAGLRIEAEVPLLPQSLQSLRAVVDLLRRSVPTVAAVRFFVPPHVVPAPVAPPPLSQLEPALAEAIEHANGLGIATPLEVPQAVPLCALRHSEEARRSFRFHPRRRSRIEGCEPATVCGGCAVEPQCVGPSRAYRSVRGDEGLQPYDARPASLYDQRTTRRRQWTDAEREAARNVSMMVLRPTVHCNQDCSFCSANETTKNVWVEPKAMLKAIARGGQRGVDRVSFSGGEPTLSKDLRDYVRAARRCGIGKIELITNGVLLDRRDKVSALRDAGLTHAFVSLHAHDETMSRGMTQKVGDFERTMNAIGHLTDAGVKTVINHVINARNHPFSTRFVEVVRERFGGETPISFAFVTPQFKALENMDLVPRISDVMPHLQRAMYRALELRQPFLVGSRQGIPPCMLGPFEPWSDVLTLGPEAQSEDRHQKQRAPQCEECRYRRFCTGLWKPYVARFGSDELVAVPGEPIDEAEAERIRRRWRLPPWGIPMSFEEAPSQMRRPELEERGPPRIEQVETPEVPAWKLTRTRPLRTALVGSGARARQLARAARRVGGLSIDAVASPHAPELGLPEVGAVPRYRDAVEAFEDIRPEAVIVASATRTHAEIAGAALERGIPVLLEKPMAARESAAVALEAKAREAETLLMPAHNLRFAAGLDEVLLGGGTQLRITRRVDPARPDAPKSWERRPLYETLHHLLALVVGWAGDAEPHSKVIGVVGDARPEGLRLHIGYRGAVAEVVWETSAVSSDELFVATSGEHRLAWRRSGRAVTLDRGEGHRVVERMGSEDESMVRAFREAVLGKARPAIRTEEGPATMRLTRLVLEALQEHGVVFRRPDAPKHARSRRDAVSYE